MWKKSREDTENGINATLMMVIEDRIEIDDIC